MNKWIASTREALASFPDWPAEVRCLDLAEEAGELARAVLVAEQRKPVGDGDPVADALCGVMVDVFALAAHYQVDLDTRYGELLAVLGINSRRTSPGPC